MTTLLVRTLQSNRNYVAFTSALDVSDQCLNLYMKYFLFTEIRDIAPPNEVQTPQPLRGEVEERENGVEDEAAPDEIQTPQP